MVSTTERVKAFPRFFSGGSILHKGLARDAKLLQFEQGFLENPVARSPH
jgi:hypothetical protein